MQNMRRKSYFKVLLAFFIQKWCTDEHQVHAQPKHQVAISITEDGLPMFQIRQATISTTERHQYQIPAPAPSSTSLSEKNNFAPLHSNFLPSHVKSSFSATSNGVTPPLSRNNNINTTENYSTKIATHSSYHYDVDSNNDDYASYDDHPPKLIIDKDATDDKVATSLSLQYNGDDSNSNNSFTKIVAAESILMPSKFSYVKNNSREDTTSLCSKGVKVGDSLDKASASVEMDVENSVRNPLGLDGTFTPTRSRDVASVKLRNLQRKFSPSKKEKLPSWKNSFQHDMGKESNILKLTSFTSKVGGHINRKNDTSTLFRIPATKRSPKFVRAPILHDTPKIPIIVIRKFGNGDSSSVKYENITVTSPTALTFELTDLDFVRTSLSENGTETDADSYANEATLTKRHKFGNTSKAIAFNLPPKAPYSLHSHSRKSPHNHAYAPTEDPLLTMGDDISVKDIQDLRVANLLFGSKLGANTAPLPPLPPIDPPMRGPTRPPSTPLIIKSNPKAGKLLRLEKVTERSSKSQNPRFKQTRRRTSTPSTTPSSTTRPPEKSSPKPEVLIEDRNRSDNQSLLPTSGSLPSTSQNDNDMNGDKHSHHNHNLTRPSVKYAPSPVHSSESKTLYAHQLNNNRTRDNDEFYQTPPQSHNNDYKYYHAPPPPPQHLHTSQTPPLPVVIRNNIQHSPQQYDIPYHHRQQPILHLSPQPQPIVLAHVVSSGPAHQWLPQFHPHQTPQAIPVSHSSQHPINHQQQQQLQFMQHRNSYLNRQQNLNTKRQGDFSQPHPQPNSYYGGSPPVGVIRIPHYNYNAEEDADNETEFSNSQDYGRISEAASRAHDKFIRDIFPVKRRHSRPRSYNHNRSSRPSRKSSGRSPQPDWLRNKNFR